MNNDQTIDILGRMGEKIVANYLREKGMLVKESVNHFDSEKDLTANGLKIEVKTQQPYVMNNSFSFRKSQLRKCQSVDILYIVSVPPLIKEDFKWGGWLFEVSKGFEYTSYTTKFKLEMIGIPIDQPAVKAVYKLNDEDVGLLKQYARSAYKR